MIDNRGAKVWPDGFPETFCVDHWRCRFMRERSGGITHAQIIALLQRVSGAGFDFIKTENLCNFDGEPGYSLGQGPVDASMTRRSSPSIMGSKSDWETMRHAAEMLTQFGVPHECRIVSAHRTPALMAEFAGAAEARGLEVIIAGAGGAAHLPGHGRGPHAAPGARRARRERTR